MEELDAMDLLKAGHTEKKKYTKLCSSILYYCVYILIRLSIYLFLIILRKYSLLLANKTVFKNCLSSSMKIVYSFVIEKY